MIAFVAALLAITPSPVPQRRVECASGCSVYNDGGAYGLTVAGGVSAGWTRDGGTTATPLTAAIGTPPVGADAGSGLGFLDGGLRVWGAAEFRGKPAGVSRGNQNGNVTLGSVDTTEGAIWISQDGNPPSDLNFFAVGNGANNEVSAASGLSLSILDTPGLNLYMRPGEVYRTPPVVDVVRRLDIGPQGVGTDAGFESTGPSGSDALKIKDGQRINLSTGDSNAYLYRWTTDGIRTPGSFAVDGFLFLAAGDASSYLYRRATDTIATVGRFEAATFRAPPRSLSTCDSTAEWFVQADTLSGVATGKRTKLCLCTSDGASAYKWQNVATGTLGTTTTCGTE